MSEFTIITTTATFGVNGDRWTRDADGDVYVYKTEEKDPVATVDEGQFVACLRTESAVEDTENLADIEPGIDARIERAVRDALHDVESAITHSSR